MRIKGIGVSLMQNQVVGNLRVMEEKLKKITTLGLEVVEIPVEGLGVIINGAINGRQLEVYAKLLKGFPLQYTTHAPLDLNLFHSDDFEVERRLLLASLEVSAAIGARMITYHPGRFVAETEFLYHPQVWHEYSQAQKEELMHRERDVMQEAAAKARALDIGIGMENLRPYLDYPQYCYAEIPHHLARQIEAIAHPALGITLDVGHLYMACQVYNLDLAAELNAVAPYVLHLHIHDNFGKSSYSWEKNQYQLLPRGRGDMHIPIGDGEVPIAAILQALAPHFNGYLIHELRAGYESEWPGLRARYTAIISRTRQNESAGQRS